MATTRRDQKAVKQFIVTPLLMKEEVAEMLGVSVRLIEKRMYSGNRRERIPHVRIGRAVRFRQEDINDWIARNVLGK